MPPVYKDISFWLLTQNPAAATAETAAAAAETAATAAATGAATATLD